ncbi:MAG TPA: hypothetical protein VF551_06405, partial [Chthoniobacterales bacterium]
ANAVRPEEVYGVLKRLAAPASAVAPADENVRIDPLAEVAKAILDKLVVPSDEAARIQAQLGTFMELAEQITDANVRDKLRAIVEDTPAHLMVSADAARAKFDTWFSSARIARSSGFNCTRAA